jgi:tRNA dimethylallyltransferase
MTSDPSFPGVLAHFIVGPTASGKSSVAHYIARLHNHSVISADSMQVYRGMDIGTAKVSLQERHEVDYHGVDIVSAAERCSAWTFCEAVRASLAEKVSSRAPVIVAGGTGLYIKSLYAGLKKTPDVDPARRAYWEQAYKEHGLTWLQNQLKSRHAAAYEAIENPANPRRLMRALEVYESGIIENRDWTNDDKPTLVGLRWPRDILVERIAQRVAAMYDQGLLDEARRLVEDKSSTLTTASQAIGYAEAFSVLEGDLTREEAVEKTTIRTRQYARRQMTWFRHQANVDWVDIDVSMSLPEIADLVMQKWSAHGPVTILAH